MKLKTKKPLKPILSDKIADVLTLKPRADIEDDQVFGTKPQTVTRGDLGSSDSEEDAAISDFRKQNVNLLSNISKKYEGTVVSRKGLAQQSNDSDEESLSGSGIRNLNVESDSEDDSENVSQNIKSIQKSDTSDSDSGSESDDYSITHYNKQTRTKSAQDDDDYEDEEEEGVDISQMQEPMEENFEHVKKQNISEEAMKGISVRNQLLVWEGLLEMRIHVQRCVNTANQLPIPETHSILKTNNEFLEETNHVRANVATVLDKLLTLQNLLYKNYPDTKALSTNSFNTEIKKKKQPDSDEEIPSDTDNEEIPSDTDADEPNEEAASKIKTNNIPKTKKRKLEDYEADLSACHKAFKTFRDTAIQKWNDKTRLATTTNIKNAPMNTILQQISYILSDKEKLIRRTQLKRSEYDIVGYKKPEEISKIENPTMKDRKDVDEYIPEIFDDSDFYHQLLRELIECKSSDISDPVQLSRQWIALQQMRSKMKRKVDTKATKGRKIKYVVHNQLVNFMAPVKCTKWTNESANELYSSLFGKMFEHNNAGVNGDVGNVFNPFRAEL